jgi:endonuclease YncB( thermonuclease family)
MPDDLLGTLSGAVTGVINRGQEVYDEVVDYASQQVGDVASDIRAAADAALGNPAPTADVVAQLEATIGEGGDSGSAAAMAQGDSNTSSTEQDPANDASRGAPHPDRNELRRGWRQQGEQRIHAFKDLYGEDALVLGHLLFRVPPLAIRVNKGNITYRWKPLRTNESIAVKSGNGECYIEIDLAFVGMEQINESLAHLITLWKKFPFCFVENGFIRSQMIPDSPEDSMMLCLESLVLDAVAGSPNTIWATLIASWFNYKTFSINAWYRRHWQGINDPGTETPEEDQSGNAESVILEQLPRSDADTTIIDLSALSEPESLTIAMPPEARLEIPEQEVDPSDPYIKPTYPVVYPWNSVPFMQRILSPPENPKFITDWTDGLTMKWNSFVRRPMPNSLAYEHDEESIPIERAESRPRTTDAAPTPVSGDRNVVVFIGDSITVGYLQLTQQYSDVRASATRNDAGQFQQVPLHQIRPPSAFNTPQTGQGFEFYSIAREGASLTGRGGLAYRFETLIGSNTFKNPGGRDGDKIAAVVLMGGINDRPGTPRGGGESNQVNAATLLTAYNRVKSLTIGANAIFCPMTPWPIYGIRDDYIDTDNETELVSLCTSIMSQWGTEDARWKAVNMHAGLSQSPTTFTGVPLDNLGYRVNTRRPPQSLTGLDPHTTGAGNQILGQHVARELPWSQMRANAGAATTWTVCYIEDGDTIWVFSNGEVRQVRFKYMNTFETYWNYNDPADTALYGQRDDPNFGTGQDSGRPQDQQFGKLAKNEVIRLLGASPDGSGNGATCEIEFDDNADAYGRYIGVISKGGVNINLHLVRQGLATVPEQYREIAEGTQYVQALTAAEQENLGYHAWRAESTLDGTRVMMEPDDWLAQHPPASSEVGGEFGFSRDNLPPGCQGSVS